MKAIKLIAVALVFGASTVSAQAVQQGKTDTAKKVTAAHKIAKSGTKAHATPAKVDVKMAKAATGDAKPAKAMSKGTLPAGHPAIAKADLPPGHPAVAAKTTTMTGKTDAKPAKAKTSTEATKKP
jgi:hypothetical protein